MTMLGFLQGEEKDNKGRYLFDYWEADNQWLEETLIYHKSPEEECFTKEALKHETINFDKESKMEEDLDELEK